MLSISRIPPALTTLAAATTLLMTMGVNAASTTASPFPAYVHEALTVVAKRSHVPILGPMWLPDTQTMGRRLMPPGGTFAATVHATPTRYQIEFWVESHALPVNSPDAIKDSKDAKPIAVISGKQYLNTGGAAVAVHDNIAAWGPIPKSAERVAITPTLSGITWMPQTAGVEVEMIAWRERGWRIEADAFPVPNVRPVITAVAIARNLVPKVMASMPGQRGTLSISTSWRDDNGTATTAMWQRGKLVYAIFTPYGVSSATTVVSSLYPAR